MKWKKISTQFLSILIAALMLIGSFPVGLQTADAATEMTLAQMRATDVYKAVKSLNSSADFTDAGKNNPGQTSYVQTFYCHCGFANCISAHGAVKNTNAMCCASFVNYYLWNTSAYGGTDKGITWRCKPSDTGQDPHTQRIGVGSVWYSLEKATEDASTGWYYAYDANPTEVNGMDYSGVAKDYANGLLYYQPGDIIIFSDSQYIYYHAAVYAGYYNGQHWIAHCTASNGGGVMLSPFNGYSIVKSNTTVYASKIFSPYYKGAIEVYKTDASTGSGLAGAEFTVRNSAGRIVATIGPTNKNGYAITSGGTSDPLLEFGTYTVTETVFPSGYESNGATSWTVTINQNSPLKSNAYVGTLNVKNKRSVGTIGVKKNDSNGSPLANVVFGVYSDSACKTLVGKMTTNSNGIATLGSLATATYYVKEISTASNAYILNTTVYSAAVKANTTTYINSGNAVVNQLKKWTLTVTKKDATADTAQGDATLQGAVYGLYNSSGTLLKQYTTDANGQFTTDQYTAGTGYYLQEITPSTGYQLNTTKVTLDNYTSPAKLTAALTTSAVSVTESVIAGKIQIKKYTLNEFANSREPESGAVFQYYLKSAGSYDTSSVSGEITTDINGLATTPDLPYGTYVIHQKSGVSGTDMITDFEVAIDENGKTYTYEKDNPLWQATLNIEKYESTTTPLVAEFTLYDSETNAMLETKSTDTSGKLTFDTKLVYGKSYYALESELAGYVTNTTRYEFSCTEKDQIITKVIENTPAEASITIRKTDSTGGALAEVIFMLEYSTDNGIRWNPVQKREDTDPIQTGYCDSRNLTADGTLTTDENGFACFTGLRQDSQTGTILYRITEVKTVSGTSLLINPVWEGQLPAEIEGQPVVDLEITVVNNPVFELPATGSNSALLLTVSGTILITFILVGIVLLKQRKKQYVNFRKEETK